MRRSIIVSLLVAGLLLPMGCSSTHYVVKTKEGTEYTSSKKPEYDKKTKSYRFKDLDGKKWTVNREEVVAIEEKKQ